MSTQSLDSDIYDYGFILNSTALHEAAMSVLITTIYGRWRGTTTGACLFHSFRRSICCPRQFTNTHLRRMLVSFICGRAEELYALLVTAISGNYSHIRISQNEYDRLMSLQQLTDVQKTQVEEFKEPGPFSIVTYCEALLKPSFYGEELCIILLSMLFKVRITIFDGDSLVAIKVRHTNTPFNTDVHLVHVSRCHYIALGMYHFILMKKRVMSFIINTGYYHV